MMSSIYERYERDPHFRVLVDQMEACIEQLKTTPLEIREAAMLAQIRFEQRNPRRLFMAKEDEYISHEAYEWWLNSRPRYGDDQIRKKP